MAKAITIDFDQKLFALDGSPLIDPDKTQVAIECRVEELFQEGMDRHALTATLSGNRELRVPITLRSVCVNVLMGLGPDERGMGGEEKARRFSLGMKVHKVKEPLELKSEQIVLLKKLIGAAYAPLVVGQVFEMLDGPVEE